jgi:chemotaxis protein MotA
MTLDIASLTGILLGMTAIIAPIAMGSNPLGFVDVKSIAVTFGGGLASTITSYKIEELKILLAVLKKAFVGQTSNPSKTIKLLVDMAQKARREGLLSLEDEISNVSDTFIKDAVQQIVDGVDPELFIETVELELSNMKMRHDKGSGILKTMASLFPAWGMLGTLIGLVQLLGSLDDPAQIGPAMAVALVTTLYGSILANYVCIPLANKLTLKSKEEIHEKNMIIEGVLSIQSGENPRILENKLKTFLSPEEKIAYDTQNHPKETGEQS